MVTKIGLLGGAFDPPTLGHLDLANYLLGNDIVDEVWLEPCYKSYYDKNMRSPLKRLWMCQAAIDDFGNDNIKLCDFEIKNMVEGETNEGIDLFFKQYANPDRQFFFMIGMDNANKIHTWGNWEELVNKIPFIVFPRNGYSFNKDITWYLDKPHLFIDQYVPIDISSTEIRKFYKNRNGNEHHNCITDSIKKMIDDFHLYKYD